MNEEFEKKLQEEVRKSKKIWNLESGTFVIDSSMARQIFATHHEVNLLRDEKGYPIPGTGRVITNDEKKMILDYIVEQKYPLTNKIYNLLLKGYINGDLILENKEIKANKL